MERRDGMAWKLAKLAWSLRLERLGNHFEDVAWCGKGWFARDPK